VSDDKAANRSAQQTTGMSPTITIRAAEPSDIEAIHAIFNCPGVTANTLQIPLRSLEWRRERFGQIQHEGSFLVAVVDGRVVGNLGLNIEQGPRRRDVGKFGMSVHDDYQNRGVGSALMAAMIDLADTWLGLRRLELEVWADNAPAIHLYEKFGFKIEGTGHQYARRAGELIDAHYMARLRQT
jgi:putative acetyltransferase